MRSLVAGSGDDHEALRILVEDDARVPEEGVVDELAGEEFEGLHAGEALARLVINGILAVREGHHVYWSGGDHGIGRSRTPDRSGEGADHRAIGSGVSGSESGGTVLRKAGSLISRMGRGGPDE